MDNVTREIAAVAARMIVEDGLDYGAAKRQALKMLGMPARTPLPANEEVEEAVEAHIALFCADTQPAELQALRALALPWMERLARFRPHIAGAVWRGTATRLSDIYLQLFCDDPKSAEIALIDMGVRFDVSTVPGFHGAMVDALSLHLVCQPLQVRVGMHLLVYDFDDLRGALKPDGRGRAPRGDTQALRQLLGSIHS